MVCFNCVHILEGSEIEKQAIRSAYMDGRGQFTYVFKNVPFATDFDKQRIQEIIEGSTVWFRNNAIFSYLWFVDMERSNFVPDFSTIPVPSKPERKLKRKRNDLSGGKRLAFVAVFNGAFILCHYSIIFRS